MVHWFIYVLNWLMKRNAGLQNDILKSKLQQAMICVWKVPFLLNFSGVKKESLDYGIKV
jgi:hypothetical protein